MSANVVMVTDSGCVRAECKWCGWHGEITEFRMTALAGSVYHECA